MHLDFKKRLNYSVSIPENRTCPMFVLGVEGFLGESPKSPKSMPSRKLTNPTKREQENPLNSDGWGGDMMDMLVPRRVVFIRQCYKFLWVKKAAAQSDFMC